MLQQIGFHLLLGLKEIAGGGAVLHLGGRGDDVKLLVDRVVEDPVRGVGVREMGMVFIVQRPRTAAVASASVTTPSAPEGSFGVGDPPPPPFDPQEATATTMRAITALAFLRLSHIAASAP